MHPVDFRYTAASSVTQVCAELPADPDGTRVLAGGMSLLPALVRRVDRPRHLVDITGIEQLRHVSVTDSGLRVGATITQRALERSAELAGYDLLRQALPLIGTVPTRNRGTVCGSLAHADPAAQLGVCLLATGGEVVARSSATARRISAGDFFLGPHRTALRSDELLTEVTFACPGAGAMSYFDQVSPRGIGDRPLVSVAVTAPRGPGSPLRVVVGGAGQHPILVPQAITATATDLGDDAIAAVSAAVGRTSRFTTDARAGGAHRSRLTVGVVERLLRRLREDLR